MEIIISLLPRKRLVCFSYGTHSLLEQWTDSYVNGYYDFDPYDDDMYEGQDIPDKIQDIWFMEESNSLNIREGIAGKSIDALPCKEDLLCETNANAPLGSSNASGSSHGKGTLFGVESNLNFDSTSKAVGGVHGISATKINMPCVSGTVNVAEIFGVPLKTLEDINNITKGIELGKYKAVFSEDGLSIIASQIGKPIMLDSYTSLKDGLSIIKSWGRSSFARCLIEINTDDVLKDSLTLGVPIIKESGFTIETINIEYEWKPPRCYLCKIFGHVYDHWPKKVLIPLIVKKTNDRFRMVGKKKKKDKSKSTNGGIITMSNSYAALDESKEKVENVYDESPNLFISTKIGESSSTLTVAAG
ncbi:zinc knuckle CX2CX4HX4C containing protein [Tanacetum coccineum]